VIAFNLSLCLWVIRLSAHEEEVLTGVIEARARATAAIGLGYTSVPEMKFDVTKQIRLFCASGIFPSDCCPDELGIAVFFHLNTILFLRPDGTRM